MIFRNPTCLPFLNFLKSLKSHLQPVSPLQRLTYTSYCVQLTIHTFVSISLAHYINIKSLGKKIKTRFCFSDRIYHLYIFEVFTFFFLNPFLALKFWSIWTPAQSYSSYEGCDQPTPATRRRSKSSPACRSVKTRYCTGNASTVLFSHSSPESEERLSVSVEHLKSKVSK